MADPEGFHAGSAWMDVKPNIDESEWHTKIAAAVGDASVSASPQIASGLSKGLDDAKPKLARDAGEVGKSIADGVAKGIGDGEAPIMDEAERIGKGLADGVTVGADGRLRDARGRFVKMGDDAGDGIGQGVKDGISRTLGDGLGDTSDRIKNSAKKTGQDAGKAAGDGMSPLIIGALAGAGAFGGSLLLAGLGTAMVGATALILRNNKAISADFTKVGADAAGAVQAAAAPLTADLHAALLGVDQQVQKMGPDFKNLFAGVDPDIQSVTQGLTGMAAKLLPGIAQATTNGQVIVKDFADSLPGFGRSVGGFFTNLTQDADVQGRALGETFSVLGNTVDVAGKIIGSAGAAASQALIEIEPVLSNVETVIGRLSNPATIGGLAGAFGAMKLDPAIASGLLTGAEGLSKIADKAVPAGGLVGKLGSAASGASGALSKMAGVVDGPWGVAIGAGIGLATGLAASLFHADDATKALTLSQGDLAAAVAQDNAKAGEATAAYIAQQAQTSGLADEAKNAGVSLSLLTEAATGNKNAMAQLTAITSAANDVQRQQQLAAEEAISGQTGLADATKKTTVTVNTLYNTGQETAVGQDKLNQSFATGSQRLLESTVASNSASDATQQLLNSVHAQTQQVADAINKQTDLNAATAALSNTTEIFDATLKSDYQQMTAKAQASAQATVATLNLGDSQSSFNQHLVASLTAYQEAQAGAQGYSGILTAMNGTLASVDDAQNSLDQSVLNARTSFKANSFSLNENTQAGINNRDALSAASKQIIAMGVAQYQASGNITQANNTIKTQIDRFVDATGATGKQKKAIEDYLDKITQIPKDVTTNVHANTGAADKAVDAFIARVDKSTGTVQVYATVHNPGGGKALTPGKAGGGPVTAGSIVPVGEHGQETVYFPQDAYVLTHGQTTAMQSRPATSPGPQIVNNFNYYGPSAPDPEQKASMLRDLAGVLA